MQARTRRQPEVQQRNVQHNLPETENAIVSVMYLAAIGIVLYDHFEVGNDWTAEKAAIIVMCVGLLNENITFNLDL